jgi:hypothetical protein
LQEEYNAIIIKWEEKENTYDETIKSELEKINENQLQRRNDIIENYKNSKPIIHPSNETLRLKKAEEGLAKQGKYTLTQIRGSAQSPIASSKVHSKG